MVCNIVYYSILKSIVCYSIIPPHEARRASAPKRRSLCRLHPRPPTANEAQRKSRARHSRVTLPSASVERLRERRRVLAGGKRGPICPCSAFYAPHAL